MTLTIAELRKFAEINMDEKCYKIYLHLIEPNIKSMLEDYLRGWQDLESLVTRMTMRTKGAYKTKYDTLLSEGDELEKYGDDIEIPIYKQVKRMTFYNKIKYLHERGVLGDSTYALLDFLNKRRNRIHGFDSAFSEVEREAFILANSIIDWIHILHSPHDYPDLEGRNRILNNCENQAFHLLNRIKETLRKD